MPAKLKFPVAKMRQDGTPAIWLTFGTWLLLKDGIVRKYLDLRESHGRRQARNEAREQFPATWQRHDRLKRWHFLDSTSSWFDESAEDALELFRIGIRSHPDNTSDHPFTAERLVGIGNRYEHQGYCEERANIQENPAFAAGQGTELLADSSAATPSAA